MNTDRRWMQQAACAKEDPDLFFPARGNIAKAAAVCKACPVLQNCRTYTEEVESDLSRNEYFGVWAGQGGMARAKKGTPRRSITALHDQIRQLSDRGMDAHTVAGLTGCTTRTVWRVTRQDRSNLGEAA